MFRRVLLAILIVGIAFPCVNLSDSGTYGSNVVNLSGRFYVNLDTTLCTDVYYFDEDANLGQVVMNKSNIRLDCNGSILDGTDSTGMGFAVFSKENVTISNCTARRYYYNFFANYSQYLLFENDTAYIGGAGFFMNSTNYSVFNNVNAQNHTTRTSPANARGIQFFNSCNYNNVTNSFFRGNYDHIYFNCAGGNRSVGNYIANNLLNTSYYATTGLAGIYLYQNVTNTTVFNNTIYNQSGNAAAADYGIYLAGAYGNNISGNVVVATSTTGDSWGVNLVASGAFYPDGNIIEYNNFSSLERGISITQGRNNNLTNNTVTDALDELFYGIYLDGTTRSVNNTYLYGNYVTGVSSLASSAAVYLTLAYYTWIEKNQFPSDYYGVLDGTNPANTTILNNTFTACRNCIQFNSGAADNLNITENFFSSMTGSAATYGYGIYTNVPRVSITNNNFTAFSGDYKYAVYLDNSDYTNVERNNFYGFSQYGLALDGTDYATIHNNTFRDITGGNRFAIFLSSSNTHNNFTYNYFNNTETFIYAAGGPNNYNLIAHNEMNYDRSSYSINLDGNNNTIDSNVINYTPTLAITLTGKDNNITNNVFDRVYRGITLSGDSDFNIIRNNTRTGRYAGPGGAPQYGIQISGATMSNNTISQFFDKGGGDCCVILSVSAGSGNTLSDSTCYATSAWSGPPGYGAIHGSYFTMNNVTILQGAYYGIYAGTGVVATNISIYNSVLGGQIAIWMVGSNLNFTKVTIINSTGLAISYTGTVNNVVFTDFYISNTTGALEYGGSNYTYTNFVVNNSRADAVRMQSDSNLTLRNATVVNTQGSCLYLSSGPDRYLYDFTCYNATEYGITSNGSSFYDLTAENITIYNVSLSGIYGNIDSSSFRNVTIYGTGQDGIRFIGGADNNIFNGTKIYDISRSSSTAYAIYLNGTSDGNLFHDTLVYNVSRNIYQASMAQVNNFTSVVFSYNESGIGRVTFPFLNISNLNLNSSNFILQPDFISLNSAAVPQANRSARIQMQVSSCTSPTIYVKAGFPTSRADVLQNGVQCTDCTIVSCSDNLLTFDVTHFSGYAVGALASLLIDNNGPKYVNETITFNATYLNTTSGHISGASCNLTLWNGSAYSMSENVDHYELSRNFSEPGTHNYNVTCSKVGFSTLTAFDTFTILYNGNLTGVDLYRANVTVGTTGRYGYNVSAGNITTEGGNVTNVSLYTNESTDRWAGFYGNVTGNIILSKSNLGSFMYTWLWNPSLGGVVCTSTNSTPFSLIAGAAASEIDTAWGFPANVTDSAENTFLNDTCALEFGVSTVSNASYADTGSSGGFITCAFKQQNYPAKGDMLFCTNITQNGPLAVGGTGDYEMMVPTAYGAGVFETYYFYVNLG